mgnify:CR=1 FL=1
MRIAPTTNKEFPVWMSDIFDLPDALSMMEQVGALTRTEEEAESIISEIKAELNSFSAPKTRKSALYLIWNNPYMAAAKNTYIDRMLDLCGFENVLDSERYPELTKEAIEELSPSVVLLSSEPFPFKEKHKQEFKQLLPNSDVKIVDGEMFSWYGSRLKYAFRYFDSILAV